LRARDREEEDSASFSSGDTELSTVTQWLHADLKWFSATDFPAEEVWSEGAGFGLCRIEHLGAELQPPRHTL